MSDASGGEQFQNKAFEYEKDCNWLKAGEIYRKASGLLPQTDFLKKGQYQEKTGYAFQRAAMQSENPNQFRERMRQAAAGYEKANEFYRKLSKPTRAPWTLRCSAMAAYIDYWRASEVPKKKSLIDDCWRLTKEAVKAFKSAGDHSECRRTYNQLSSSAFHEYALEWDFETRKKTIEAAIDYGEQVIALPSSANDSYELARVYTKTASYLTMFGWFFIPDLEKKMDRFRKSIEYWQKALSLSEEAALLELLTIPGGSERWNTDEMLKHHERALVCARKTRDKHLIGTALDKLAYASFWKAVGIEDPDKRVETFQRALKYAEDAKQQFSAISYASPRGDTLWAGAPRTEYYWIQAIWETDAENRRDLLERALADGTRAIRLAESTGYPEIISTAHHVLSKVLGSLAQGEPNAEKKKKLLEKALEHRKESVTISERLVPLNYWVRGVMWNYMADLKTELSQIEKDPQNQKDVLEEAVSNKELCLQLCIKDSLYFEKIGELSYFAALGYYQSSYGELLNRLYELTSNEEHRRKAIRAFEQAAETYQKLALFSYAAECLWRAARGYDVLGEHQKAAEEFNLASDNYTRATAKIPQLKEFYQDHALYMQAWGEIEKARDHHERQEYGTAKEHYEKTAAIHKSLKQWRYLAPNYEAWAQVENAEELSREEHSDKALRAFTEAAELFNETKKSLQTELKRIENSDEKQMATNLLNATDLRRDYCTGRIALEEAKILDKKGDHYSSSKKYSLAADIFEKIAEALELEEERKELRLITTLSHAWQKMTQAETEASPTLYKEASQLFEEAKELSPNEKAKMLALGHSRFCRALEAGTTFTDTGDTTLHATVVHHLESAANYYMKTDFQSASEYAKAMEMLFDAYLYMGNAQKEEDPEKKAKLYTMAEKVLQISADSFMKAEHPEKKEQVLRLLNKVRQDRELALSLSEVLHAPSIVSTTAAFASPTPTEEKAVGLERFEHANIQAYLAAPEEVSAGETFEVRLDMANVAKEPGLLVRIENLISPNFKITETAPECKWEDGSIDVKGKRLEPQKLESIRIRATAPESGIIHINPRIVYVDELGKFKLCQPDPVTVAVYPPGKFQFSTENAQRVFEYLTKAFVDDYMGRKLTLDKSGWRTLMQIVRDARVSKSSVYGTTARRGSAISELERRGVVELRIFSEERGRGGKIAKTRITYEKDIVKRYVDQSVMKIKEK
jgi:tetratricopeptide (TPR) repeat protein